jgi:hypothetical protein
MASAYLDLNACPDIKRFAAAFACLTSVAIETNTEKTSKDLCRIEAAPAQSIRWT